MRDDAADACEANEYRHARRRFLVNSLLGVAAVASGVGCARPGNTSGNSARNAARPSAKLGVALLGLGKYAETQLAPALLRTQHCTLRGIVTGTPDKVPRWQKQYALEDRHVYDYGSLARIADDAAVQVVYVVTPTALHAKYAIMAAEAGKHVWCEKPMAMNSAECQSIIDACRKNGVFLSIGYRMQHEPNTRTIMSFAREKPYGAIQSLRASAGDRSDDDQSWRMKREMGGGALYDMGVYSIDALRYASGEEPLRVLSARQWSERKELFSEVDEISEFELEFPSGARGVGRASRADGDNVLRVEAERGWYKLEPMQSYQGVQGETSDGRKLDAKVDNQQARQMDDDALAIVEGRPALVPGEEAQRDIRILEAIVQAAAQKRPVTL